jgi:heat shock protein HtpX
MFKRVALFLLTNAAVLVTISIVVRLFGLDRVLLRSGIDYPKLAALSLVYGFAGSIISLLLSKTMAKFSAGAVVITSPRNETEQWLVSTVARLAQQAGIQMPEVAIFNSPSPNAFATGAFRNSALVAVSTGLLELMNRSEVEAVLGHELSHVANGDMVTMTLVQGVINSFVVFFTYLARLALSRDDSGRRRDSGASYGISIVVQLVLTLLGSLIAAWFSRYREFRADAGGASLASRQAMINALARLGGVAPTPLPGRLSAFGISGPIGALFSTHPPIEKRIAALQQAMG